MKLICNYCQAMLEGGRGRVEGAFHDDDDDDG